MLFLHLFSETICIFLQYASTFSMSYTYVNKTEKHKTNTSLGELRPSEKTACLHALNEGRAESGTGQVSSFKGERQVSTLARHVGYNEIC